MARRGRRSCGLYVGAAVWSRPGPRPHSGLKQECNETGEEVSAVEELMERVGEVALHIIGHVVEHVIENIGDNS